MSKFEDEIVEKKDHVAVFLSKIQTLILDKKFQFICFFIVGLFAGYALNESQQKHYTLPQWAIIDSSDVKENPEEANALFNKRIEEEFFSGLEEKFIIRDLRKAGFRLDWRTTTDAKLAFHYEWDLSCKNVRTISWQVDEQNIIITASGSYWRTCEKD